MMDPGLLKEAVVLAVFGACGLALLWYLRRGHVRPGALAPSPRGSDASVRAMGDLLEELRRTSQAMTASLDRRTADLKALIAEADARLARLEALKDAAPAPAAAAPPAATRMEPDSDVSPEMKAVMADVYRQADEGRIVTDIARDTGLNKTAVSLILGLRDMQRQSGGPGRPGAAR